MSFFYDLNKKLNGIGAEEKKLVESKQAPKTPARQTLEQALRQDLKSLMEGQVNEVSQSTKDSYAKKAKTEVDIYNRNKNNPGASSKDKEVAAKSAAKREKGLEKVKEDGTGGMNFSGSGSLEEKAGYSAKKAAAGKDIGKPGKNFAKIEKSAAKKYGSKEAGARVAGAVLNKLRHAKESITNEGHCPACDCSPCKCNESMEESGLQAYLGNKKYGKEGMDALRKAGREHAGKDKMNQIRNRYDKMDESGMECDTPMPAKGIPGNVPLKDKMKRLNKGRDYYESDDADDSDEDIMDYLNRKLAPHDKEQQTKEDAISKPYNGPADAADAYNGMEFEGNAFTGKLASTPKGGEFELDGNEYKDTSSLEEQVSRKHFQQVADLLRNIPDEAKRKEMAMHHASIFKQQNPRFDMRRFAAAAGVDLEECAMWEELKGGQKKLDRNHNGKLDANDFAMLRKGNEMTDEGWDDMNAWLAQREKEKGTGKFDKRKVSTGTVYTRRFDDEPEDDTDAPASKGGAPRGRGRPAGTKRAIGAKGPTGNSKLMKKDAIREKDEELDEKAEAGKRKFFDKLAPAAKKVAKVVAKVTAGKEDDKAEKAGKKVAKDIEHDEGHKGKDDNKAEKAGKKVTKDIEYDDKKDRKEKKTEGAKPDFLDMDKDGDKKEPMKKAVKDKEEKVDETTTSGSVATGGSNKAASGMGIGQGIYDSINRKLESMISESINVAQEAVKMEDGNEEESITVTVTGDDVHRFKELLQAMGVDQGGHDHEGHGEEPCPSCGGVPCQCDELAEADAPVTPNDPDYPTNQEESDDALQYSGGLDGPKSTGQATIPVIASQKDRQMSEGRDMLDLYRAVSNILK
jgi:Ca2+-binding EF-hand superfamily protein